MVTKTEPTTEFVQELIPYSRRVFCNRNLRMDTIRYIGFDMDYSLALYKPAMEHLQAELVLNSMVDVLGYPRSILALKYAPQFAIRGLVVDTEHGNIFKMNAHRFVGMVWHGEGPLDKEIRRDIYTNRKIDLSDPGLMMVDTQFSLPEMHLYCQLVGLFDKQADNESKPTYDRLWRDLRGAMDVLHSDDSLKTIVRGNIPEYIYKDPDLPETLHRFRSAGKKLFLLTNSEPEYTRAVMTYLLDQGHPGYAKWEDYFDFIIASARKPGFFVGDTPFLHSNEDGSSQSIPVTQLRRGQIYTGGNLQELKQWTGMRGDEVLYVGDHLYGDILRSKRDTSWRTAMVVQELERELLGMQEHGSDLTELDRLESRLFQINLERAAHAIDGNRDRRLQGEARQLNQEVLRLEKQICVHFNHTWGMMVRDRAELSAFGAQMQDYACIYTSRVSNFRLYSPVWYFRSPRQRMPHEQLR